MTKVASTWSRPTVSTLGLRPERFGKSKSINNILPSWEIQVASIVNCHVAFPKAPLAVGSTFRSVPNCPSAQGQLQETPSALRLVPDPACSLGGPLLASPGLQVRLKFCPHLTHYGSNPAQTLPTLDSMWFKSCSNCPA